MLRIASQAAFFNAIKSMAPLSRLAIAKQDIVKLFDELETTNANKRESCIMNRLNNADSAQHRGLLLRGIRSFIRVDSRYSRAAFIVPR